ncbi:MAG: hypothetical protein ABIP94_23960 [Planctomycetota bacterium]
MFHVTPAVILFAALGTAFCASAIAQVKPALEVAPSHPDLKPKDNPIVIAGLAHLELSTTLGSLRARLHGASPGFAGVVLLSTSPNVTQFGGGLPPLLSDFVVWNGGYTDTQDLELRSPNPMPDFAPMMYGQALLFDPHGIWVGGIVPIANPSWVRATGVDATDAKSAAASS